MNNKFESEYRPCCSQVDSEIENLEFLYKFIFHFESEKKSLC